MKNPNAPPDDLARALEDSADEWAENRPDAELVGEVLLEAETLAKRSGFTRVDFDRYMERVRGFVDDPIKFADVEADLRALLP